MCLKKGNFSAYQAHPATAQSVFAKPDACPNIHIVSRPYVDRRSGTTIRTKRSTYNEGSDGKETDFGLSIL